MSWSEIIIILAVGMFVLGPERIPVAVKWVGSTLKTVRTMAAGAQEQLRGEFGPELEELRRQIADLQSLKEIQELRTLRDLNPRSMISKNLLGEEFSGGVSGFLGLNKTTDTAQATGSGVAAGIAEPEHQSPFEAVAPDAVGVGAVASEPVAAEPVDSYQPHIPAVVINQPTAIEYDPAPVSVVKSAPRHAAVVIFDDDAT